MSDCLILRSLLKIKNLTNTTVLEPSYRKFYLLSHPSIGEIIFLLYYPITGNYIIHTLKDYERYYRYYDITLQVKNGKENLYVEKEDFNLDKDIDMNTTDMELVLLFSRGILDTNIKIMPTEGSAISFKKLKENAEYLD